MKCKLKRVHLSSLDESDWLQDGVCVQHPAEADLSKLPHPDYVWGFKSLPNRNKETLPKGKAASMRWLPLNVEVFNIRYFTTMSLTAVFSAQTKIWS